MDRRRWKRQAGPWRKRITQTGQLLRWNDFEAGLNGEQGLAVSSFVFSQLQAGGKVTGEHEIWLRDSRPDWSGWLVSQFKQQFQADCCCLILPSQLGKLPLEFEALSIELTRVDFKR